MPDLIETLRTELATLESELASDPRYKKVLHIRELIALYGESVATQPITAQEVPTRRVVRVPWRAKEPSKAQRTRDAISQFLEPRGIVHRTEILDHLTSLGLMEGIKKPMANLAAFISDHKEMFRSHGGGRWSLASSSNPESETPNSDELFGAPQSNGAEPLHA